MDSTLLDRGRAAAAGGDWQQTYDLLMEADAGRPLEAEDLGLLAETAYATGHLHITIEAWERAHALNLQSGDRLGAAGAATRVAMHLLFDTALMAPVRGWIKRAESLLDDQAETPVHAWIAVVRSYERLLSGDFESARQWARRAIEVGALCDPAAAALGRIAEARSLILNGEVRDGLELLNEAAVATISGELDPLTTGIVYCELVCAMQALAQYDLAEEWTQAMEQWRHGQPVGSLHGRCRVHRAEILRLRGSNTEAEEEALLACDELRPYLRREFGWPLTELGRIRLRKGDLEGAEQAFVAARRAGWDPQPGLAMTYLARGDVKLAASAIRNALEHPSTVPSKELPPNTELRRAPLLEAQVEIAIAAGDVDRARWAVDELEEVSTLFGSKALFASAVGARARVQLAEGDAAGARRDFETAMQLWREIGAPYEAALAHMGIAQGHFAAGDEDSARLEFEAARSTFEEVGAVQQAERARHACAALSDGTEAEKRNQMGQAEQRKRAQMEQRKQTIQREETSAMKAPALEDNIFRRDGEYWTIGFAGHNLLLRDGKGLRYLTCLLADPGREFHVLEIVALERGRTTEVITANEPRQAFYDAGDAGELLDTRAKDAYRRRLAEIEDDAEEARAIGDVERETQAETEREFLVKELARAIGLGGRGRRAGSPSERARAAVTRAIRSAMARIREHNPELGEHLDRSIRTGTYCAYLPDTRAPVAWTL